MGEPRGLEVNSALFLHNYESRKANYKKSRLQNLASESENQRLPPGSKTMPMVLSSNPVDETELGAVDSCAS